MKICKGCNKDKEESEFSFRNKQKGTLQRLCKECKRKEDQQSYSKDNRKISIRKAQRNSVNRLRLFIEDFKKGKCCNKCGDKRWYVLDFHHLKDKSFAIANGIKRCISTDKLMKEIEKCELLCANCHRELHYLEKLAVNSVVECNPDTIEVTSSNLVLPTESGPKKLIWGTDLYKDFKLAE